MSPRPEVLAPAGSPEALTAAVRCGADAVYLGAGAFNARRNAHNFTAAALDEAVAYCHSRNVKVYLTLNTLIRQDELPAVMQVVERACALGIDALIVQDLGLAALVRRAAPELPLHASTQLSCHTPAGVRLLASMGFKRVVLAREMTLEEIAACMGQGCEIEIFVHGALCMCVSGQCYLSAMLGGRSGNRGLCAQPCRLPFAPLPAKTAGDRRALSLKDLSLQAHLAALSHLGVDSLKIEGRMKRPEYVAAAVSVYAGAVRGETPRQEALQDLQAVFSRSGFTDGYLTGQRGKAMFGAREKEDVTAAAPVLRGLAALYAQEQPRIPLKMELTVKRGHPARLRLTGGGRQAEAFGALPEEARSRGLDEERVRQQLGKTGGTPFYLESLKCELEDGLTLSAAALNALRREALALLEAEGRRFTPKSYRSLRFDITNVNTQKARPKNALIARCVTLEQLEAAGTELSFLPLDIDWSSLPSTVSGKPLGVEIPRGIFGREEPVRRKLREAAKAGASWALCNNVGALPLALEAGLKPLGGFGLNITNREALDAWRRMGLQAALLSMELTFRQLSFAQGAGIPTGLLIYGRQPLMLMRNCPRGASTGCSGCDGKGGGGLVDRRGAIFPLACSGGCAELLNSARLYWADKLEQLPDLDFRLLHFTDETPEQAAAVVRAYRQGGAPLEGITRGLYRRGVE